MADHAILSDARHEQKVARGHALTEALAAETARDLSARGLAPTPQNVRELTLGKVGYTPKGLFGKVKARF